MEAYNPNPFTPMLVISIIFIAICFLSMKFRQYFSKATVLPTSSVAVKSALFSAGIVTIICFGVLILLKIYSIKGYEYFILVPIAALIGAIYGAVFVWLKRKKNLATSLLNRVIVAFSVGAVLGIAFSLICAINFDYSYNPSPGYSAILDLMVLYLIPICILIATTFFGLFTPRNVLLDKVSASNKQ